MGADSSRIGLRSITSDGTTQWETTLEMSTGLYSIKNVDSNTYLTASGQLCSIESFIWHFDLQGDRDDATYSLSADGVYLSVPVTVDGSDITSSAVQWTFDQLAESAIATPLEERR